MADLLADPTTNLPISSPEQRAARLQHREWIGGSVKALLSIYWQDREAPAALEAAVLRDWIDALEGFPQDVIGAARRRWISENTRRPTPADIVGLCRRMMPKPRVVASEPDDPVQKVTPEAALEILAQTGWNRRLRVKRMSKGDDA